MEVHRGEVFYADLSPVVGSEQGGVRPVLIVQNEIGNRHSPTASSYVFTCERRTPPLPKIAWCCWSRSARWISTACGSGPGRSRRKIRNVWIRLWM